MAFLRPDRVLQAIRQTPTGLQAVLIGVSADAARMAVDEKDGWSVTALVCHLRDYENMIQQRIYLMLGNSVPSIPSLHSKKQSVSPPEAYAHEDVSVALQQFIDLRRQTVIMLNSIDEDEWQRSGLHPSHGEMTLTEVVMKTAIHDVGHVAQIGRVLGRTTQLE